MSRPRSISDDHSDVSPRLAEALEAYVERLEAGETPSARELSAAYPELAGILPDYLDGVRMIHDAFGAESHPRPPISRTGMRDGETRDEARRIGDYELVREIGRGGMGVVYEARQISLARRVALKMLPFAAVLDERHVKRFQTEAQAAAGLHHPNIIPVFAVGQDRGVYYYAMQYVEGRSLAQAIDELRADRSSWSISSESTKSQINPSHGVTTIDRRAASTRSAARSSRGGEHFRVVAELGIQAAEALQHAHDYGVVHRDVKPSNLMLDGAGKLWVADFGLARISTEATVTMPGDVVGTLRYMSPEQARGRGDMIDGRTDIYALGATLYEMVTRVPAHPGDDQRTLLRRIESVDPTPPRRLNPSTPADLETIILRAMQKSREDRYETARELADDLRRFLDGKPTIARRPGLAERAGRWLVRHRRAALTAATSLVVVAAVSLAAVAALVAANQRASDALAESDKNLARAEAHYEQARSAVDHFAANVADELVEIPGAERLRRRLLQSTLGYYHEFLRTTDEEPSVRGGLAATHFKAATIAERLGDMEEARTNYAEAVTHWRALDSRGDLALSLGRLAIVEARLSSAESASRLFAESVGVAQELVDEAPDDHHAIRTLAVALSNRGAFLRRRGDRQAAAEQLRDATTQFERALHLAPDDSSLIRSAAVAQSNLGETLRASDSKEALAWTERALESLRRVAELRPDEDSSRVDLAMALNNAAAVRAGVGNWALAAIGYREAVHEAERLVRRQPFAPSRRQELAIALGNLGFALAKSGDEAASDEAFDRAAQTMAVLSDDFPDQERYRLASAALWNNRGVALRELGRTVLATAAFSRSVAMLDEITPAREGSRKRGRPFDAPYENLAAAIPGETSRANSSDN